MKDAKEGIESTRNKSNSCAARIVRREIMFGMSQSTGGSTTFPPTSTNCMGKSAVIYPICDPQLLFEANVIIIDREKTWKGMSRGHGGHKHREPEFVPATPSSPPQGVRGPVRLGSTRISRLLFFHLQPFAVPNSGDGAFG